MAINQNHLFEELNGVKCAIVEKNASTKRVAFLQSLLVFNRYTVVVVPSPPPKSAPAPAPASAPTPTPATATPAAAAALSPAAAPPLPPGPMLPETFTVGVTDVTFNPTNAIFGRLLRTPDGHIVTLAYWQQKEKVSHDEVPYFESGK
jgi:hypothetical protein